VTVGHAWRSSGATVHCGAGAGHHDMSSSAVVEGLAAWAALGMPLR
jgi:hypothetical protein